MLSGIEEIKVIGAYIFVFGFHCPSVIRVLPSTRDIEPYVTFVPSCISVGPKNY